MSIKLKDHTEGEWHKMCALIMSKCGVSSVEISAEEFRLLLGTCIVATELDKGAILIELVSLEEAHKRVNDYNKSEKEPNNETKT